MLRVFNILSFIQARFFGIYATQKTFGVVNNLRKIFSKKLNYRPQLLDPCKCGSILLERYYCNFDLSVFRKILPNGIFLMYTVRYV